MSADQLDELVDTLLWEGHQLYPYTPSATKNATPTPFGIVYPRAHAEGSPHRFARLKLQCVATGTEEFSATVHFLESGQARRVAVTPGAAETFLYGSVSGRVALGVEDFAGVKRVTVDVHNTTDVPAGLTRGEALGFSLLSTHVVVRCGAGGRFASPVAPPEDLATAVMTCANVNTHPVLASAADDAILGAAIFLPDHPEIAPESRGSLFDSTEIEEALLLHVLALSDAERQELATADPAVRAMIERAISATPADIIALHGRVTVSDPAPVVPAAPAGDGAELRGEEAIVVDGRTFRRGGHVVLRPERNRNAQDHLLEGRSATIERIYIDYADAVHLCVTVDDDPGQDLMRDIGRYLYFKPDEVEETTA
ncbi:MAG: hypothetical protein JWR63_28 [Conexibacter sp.]|nr:hypothetical protein [Conexibacter sp.]